VLQEVRARLGREAVHSEIMPVVLTTERLLLRLPEPTDAEALHRAYRDAEVMRYVGDGKPFTFEQTRATVERFRERWRVDGFGALVVERADGGGLIGEVDLLAWDRATWAYGFRSELGSETELEVGWTLARDAWGRGYATEAAIALRDWAFDELKPPRLISMIFPANVRSQRVAAKIGERFDREIVTASGKRTQLWST
jgi:RimJ/RimL family protein N-acetyltransferase